MSKQHIKEKASLEFFKTFQHTCQAGPVSFRQVKRGGEPQMNDSLGRGERKRVDLIAQIHRHKLSQLPKNLCA